MGFLLFFALALAPAAEKKKLNLGVVTGEQRRKAEARATPREEAAPVPRASPVAAASPAATAEGDAREAGGAADLLDLTRTPPELEERKKGASDYVMTCRDGNGRIYKEGEAGFDLCADKARRDASARTSHGSTPDAPPSASDDGDGN